MAADDTIDLGAVGPDSLYPPELAARIVRKTPKTLANWRCERRGPAVTYVGDAPFYRGTDLLKFIERGRVDFAARTTATPRRQRAAA